MLHQQKYFAPVLVENVKVFSCNSEGYKVMALLSQVVSDLDSNGKIISENKRTVLCTLNASILDEDLQSMLNSHPNARIYRVISQEPVTTKTEDELFNKMQESDSDKARGFKNSIAKRQLVKDKYGNLEKYEENYQYAEMFFDLSGQEDQDERSMSEVYNFDNPFNSASKIDDKATQFINLLNHVIFGLICLGNPADFDAKIEKFNLDVKELNEDKIKVVVAKIASEPTEILLLLNDKFNDLGGKSISAIKGLHYASMALGLFNLATKNYVLLIRVTNMDCQDEDASDLVKGLHKLRILAASVTEICELFMDRKDVPQAKAIIDSSLLDISSLTRQITFSL